MLCARVAHQVTTRAHRPAEAADVAAHACLAVLTAGPDAPAELVARRAAWDYLWRQVIRRGMTARRGQRGPRGWVPVVDGDPDDSPGREPDPAHVVADADWWASRVRRLKPRHARAVLLRARDEFDLAGVGAALGVTKQRAAQLVAEAADRILG